MLCAWAADCGRDTVPAPFKLGFPARVREKDCVLDSRLDRGAAALLKRGIFRQAGSRSQPGGTQTEKYERKKQESNSWRKQLLKALPHAPLYAPQVRGVQKPVTRE